MNNIDPITLLPELDKPTAIPADVDRRIRSEMSAALVDQKPKVAQPHAELLELVPSGMQQSTRWNRRALGVAASLLVLVLGIAVISRSEPSEQVAVDASSAPPPFLVVCSEFGKQVTVDGQPWSSGEPELETRLTTDERAVLLEQLNEVRLHPVADPARRSIDEAIATVENDSDLSLQVVQDTLQLVGRDLKDSTGVYCIRPG